VPHPGGRAVSSALQPAPDPGATLDRANPDPLPGIPPAASSRFSLNLIIEDPVLSARLEALQ
jgi:hypothetical protein